MPLLCQEEYRSHQREGDTKNEVEPDDQCSGVVEIVGEVHAKPIEHQSNEQCNKTTYDDCGCRFHHTFTTLFIPSFCLIDGCRFARRHSFISVALSQGRKVLPRLALGPRSK